MKRPTATPAIELTPPCRGRAGAGLAAAVMIAAAGLLAAACGPDYRHVEYGRPPEALVPGAIYHADLSARGLANPVNSGAAGYARARLYSDRLEINGAYRGLSRPLPGTRGQLYPRAPRSQPGAYLVSLTDVGEFTIARLTVDPDTQPGSDAPTNSGMMFGRLELTGEQADQLARGRLKLLIRTDAYPGGEIAGRLQRFEEEPAIGRPIISTFHETWGRPEVN